MFTTTIEKVFSCIKTHIKKDQFFDFECVYDCRGVILNTLYEFMF